MNLETADIMDNWQNVTGDQMAAIGRPMADHTVWARVYTPGGFQSAITIKAFALDDLPNAAELDALLAAKGYLPALPGLEPGQKKETITSVIRRAKPSDGTPIIDFYADFGQFKWATMYIDSDSEVAEFEARSGLRLADLPLIDSRIAIDRPIAGKMAEQETPVKRSFDIVRTLKPDATPDKPRYYYDYWPSDPIATPAAADVFVWTDKIIDDLLRAAAKHLGLSALQVSGVIGPTSDPANMSQYTKESAWRALEDYANESR